MGEDGKFKSRREQRLTKILYQEALVMAYNGFAIDEYLDAAEVTRQLDELKKSPVYSINRDALQGYVDNYFEKKCSKSKELIGEAKEIIPGGFLGPKQFAPRKNHTVYFKNCLIKNSCPFNSASARQPLISGIIGGRCPMSAPMMTGSPIFEGISRKAFSISRPISS